MWRARNDIGCLGLTWARRGQRWYLLHFLVVSNRHYAACRNYSLNAEWSTCCSTCEAQDLREETRPSAHSSRSWGRSFPQAHQALLSPAQAVPWGYIAFIILFFAYGRRHLFLRIHLECWVLREAFSGLTDRAGPSFLGAPSDQARVRWEWGTYLGHDM